MFIPIIGYEDYLINTNGQVFSTKVNRLLVEKLGNEGYKYYGFSIQGKTVNFYTHRLLAFMYLGLNSLQSKLEVHHKDDNKLNNSLDNLICITKEEHNILHNGEYTVCCVCNKKIRRNTKTYTCKSCIEAGRPTITLEELVSKVLESNWSKAGKFFGLSDNGLRKRYIKLSNGKNPKNIKEDYNESNSTDRVSSSRSKNCCNTRVSSIFSRN